MVKTEEVSVLRVWVCPDSRGPQFVAPHLSFTQNTFIILSSLVVPPASFPWNSAWVALSSSIPPGATQSLPHSCQTRAKKPLTLSQRPKARSNPEFRAGRDGGRGKRKTQRNLVAGSLRSDSKAPQSKDAVRLLPNSIGRGFP